MAFHSQGIVLLISLSFLVSLLQVSAKAPCEFPVIFNFGDSNSDTGGNAAAFGENVLPYGETFFKHGAGRYSDGRLIIDFMAQSLGLPFLRAFLDSVGSNFTNGVNFAVAGATIRDLKTNGVSPIALNVQHVEFDDFYRRSQIFRNEASVFKGLLPNPESFKSGLYTFDIGQNDLTAGYFGGMTTDQVKAYVPDVLEKFKTVIKGIYWYEGGRYFWIHNTGPVGCYAYIMDNLQITAAEIDEVGCADPFNEVAKFFNKELKEAVAELRNELPEAAITYVDIYSVKYDLISNAKKYGFEHPLRACCGHGGKYNYNINIGCGMTKTVKGKQVVIGKACKNPSKAISWDGVHFTDAGNKFVFERIVNGSYSDPPLPLNMACYRQ